MSDESKNGQLGWIVSWRVPAMVALSALREAIINAGMSLDLLAEMKSEQALRRALREMSDSRVIRKLRREADTVYFQVTHETVTETSATYSREAEVSLDVNTGIVTGDDSEITAQAQALLNEHLSKRLTMDLTKLVQRYFDSAKADLIPIREQGGAYFVPEQHASLVENSRKLLDGIGGKLRSFAIRFGSGDTSESIADSLTEYMSDLLSQFRDSCAGINEDTRSDAKANRLARIAEIKTKLECYGGLMSAYASTIASQVAQAETELIKALSMPAPVENQEVAHAG